MRTLSSAHSCSSPSTLSAARRPPHWHSTAGRRGGARPGRGRRAPAPRPEPLPFEDHAGFESIFDGTTLKGWDGDPTFWRAEDGAHRRREHAEKQAGKQNTFIIWRGGEPGDFELKVEFRINATNSGIQIRSVQLPPPDPQGQPMTGKWVMKGYQADIDFANRFTGQIYEERGRGFLAMRGQMSYVHRRRTGAEGHRRAQQAPTTLKGIIKVNDWNQVHVIARGNTHHPDPQRPRHQHPCRRRREGPQR